MQDGIQTFYEQLHQLSNMADRPEDIEEWLLLTIGQTQPCCGQASKTHIAALRELGILYRKLGQLPQALTFAQKAAECSKQSCAPNSPEVISALLHLGCVHRAMGEVASAHQILDDGRARCQAGPGEQSPLYSALMHNLSLTCRDQGDIQGAIAAGKAAAKSAHASNEAPEVQVEILVSLAGFSLQAGDFNQATGDTDAALQLARNSQTPPQCLAQALNASGVVAFQREDFSAAHSFFQEELSLLHRLSPQATPHQGTLCVYLSHCCEHLQQPDAALAWMQQGCLAFSQALGHDHPSSVLATEAVSRLEQTCSSSASELGRIGMS